MCPMICMSVPREKLATSLVLLSLLSMLLISSVLIKPTYAALSYPRLGQITKGSGGALWNAWNDKEEAVPYFIGLADSYGGSYESIGKSSGNKGWDIVLFKFGNPNGGTDGSGKPGILKRKLNGYFNFNYPFKAGSFRLS